MVNVHEVSLILNWVHVGARLMNLNEKGIRRLTNNRRVGARTPYIELLRFGVS